eukprot:1825020-Pleurochrysis_carterae.AAC.4
MDAWRALFNFHEAHPTADSMPFSPRVLPVGEGDGGHSMTLTGLPIAWSELWSKLRGRFARSHLSGGQVGVDVEASTGADSL